MILKTIDEYNKNNSMVAGLCIQGNHTSNSNNKTGHSNSQEIPEPNHREYKIILHKIQENCQYFSTTHQDILGDLGYTVKINLTKEEKSTTPQEMKPIIERNFGRICKEIMYRNIHIWKSINNYHDAYDKSFKKNKNKDQGGDLWEGLGSDLEKCEEENEVKEFKEVFKKRPQSSIKNYCREANESVFRRKLIRNGTVSVGNELPAQPSPLLPKHRSNLLLSSEKSLSMFPSKPSHSPSPSKPFRKILEKCLEKPEERPLLSALERPFESVMERHFESALEKPFERPSENKLETPLENDFQKSKERPPEKSLEKVLERSFDKSVGKGLKKCSEGEGWESQGNKQFSYAEAYAFELKSTGNKNALNRLFNVNDEFSHKIQKRLESVNCEFLAEVGRSQSQGYKPKSKCWLTQNPQRHALVGASLLKPHSREFRATGRERNFHMHRNEKFLTTVLRYRT